MENIQSRRIQKRFKRTVLLRLTNSRSHRHYPNISSTTILPSSESHFLVSELIHSLEGKENVEIHRAEFLHSFMDSHSENFDQRGYDQFLEMLKSKR